MDEEKEDKRKPHRDRHAGRKAEKKKTKNEHVQELTAKQRNPKAFTFNSAVRAERKFRRTQDIQTKKQHIPVIDRTPLEPPPIMVVVVGPPKVGKTTLIHCLIKCFTKQPLTTMKGPVTVISGKKRRITFIECNNDINSMIDLAKVADLVLLLIDASFGFEMEIFEFLNICQVHGMPKVMGVLTHLDMLKHTKILKRTKKTLKHRFWTEVYAGAKLFYLSGLLHDEYLRNEVKNLGRFISVMKFRPLTWQTTHPYMLADRMEDITSPEFIRQNPKVDRTVCLYGYVRGVPLNKSSSIHIPGCGDMKIGDICFLPDPCPLPDKLKKRSLVEKERFIYAPFSGVGGIVYDKDAVYIELAGSHSHHNEAGGRDEAERDMVSSLLDTRNTLDEKIARSQVQLFSGAEPITDSEFVKERPVKEMKLKEEKIIDSEDGRTRRKVIFPDNDNKDIEEDSSADEDSGEEFNDEKDLNEQSTLVNVDSDEEEDDIEDLLEKSKAAELEEMHKSENKNVHEKKRKLKNLESDSDSIQNESEEDLETPTKKKKKINSTETKENNTRYHEVSSNKDKEIRDKISGALAMFTDTKHKRDSGGQADSAFSDNDSSDDSDSKLFIKQEDRNKKLHYDSSDDSNSDEQEDSDIESDVDDKNDSQTQIKSEESSESEESDSSEEEKKTSDTSAVNWKTNLAQKAADAFIERQASTANLWKLVYGNESMFKVEEEKNNNSAEENEVGGLFRVVSKAQEKKQQQRDTMNAPDVSKFPTTHIRDWSSKEAQSFIKDCFVTGKWKKSEDASELLKLDDASDFDDDEDVFGDFEDLETGEKHSGQSKKKTAVDEDDNGSNEEENKPCEPLTKAQLMERKMKLKEKFNAEYDDKGGDSAHYDELKQEATKQAELNRTQFEGLDDTVRVQLEGYRAGMYVRLEINSVPCELITNFDPTFPLIVGGLQTGEENVGFLKVRIKKHRWYKKILKTKDPLIVSLGWRRFQTLAIYSKLEDNMRHRMLKYTPEHVSCMAHFWGPLTRTSTGFLAVQDVASKQTGFRIVATGSVVDTNQSVEVTKKLKLTGVPLKIYKKTAFIQGMFNSTLEVAKFEGARIKTVSGIRGQIKKAANKPEGAFRATFEDKIQLSDIVFCRTWYKVEIPKLYNPVTSLLLPVDEKNQWRGMKTVGQLKREQGLKSEPQVDSMYKPIVREEPVFKPLSIPRKLQKQLPYKNKPKFGPKHNRPLEKVAVVRDIQESKVASMMKKLQTVYKHKQQEVRKASKKKLAEYRKQIEAENKRKIGRQREMKKDVFRTLSKLEAKNKGKHS